MKNLLTYYINKLRYWFVGMPAVQRFGERYPKAASFIGNRFNPKIFVGLPLTLVLLACCVNIMLLSALTESVLEAEWVVVTDKEFTQMLYSMRSEKLSLILFAFTHLAERITVFIVGGIFTLYYFYRKRFWHIIAFWLAMGGVGLTVTYAKTFISRARPADVAYYEVVHYSFPSGHATTAMALYGLLAYFIYRQNSRSPYRKLIPWVAAILIILVGFSRIYLGVHYLSDVLAGFLLGLLWMLVGVSLVEVVQYRKNKYQK